VNECSVCQKNEAVLDLSKELAGELFEMIESFKAQAPKKALRQDSRFRRWEALMERWVEAAGQ
jgi:hypothetical protein